MPWRFPRVLRRSRVLALACTALLVTGCGEGPTSGRRPAGWTSWETKSLHRRARADAAAAEVEVAARSDEPSVREAAIRKATIAGIPLGELAMGVPGQPWFVRLARCIHESELGTPGTDPEAELRSLALDPGVCADLSARRLCTNALGCHLMRRAQRAHPDAALGGARLRLFEQAIKWFEASSGLPQAAVNLAAARLEQARLAPDARGAALQQAGIALASLGEDALTVPWQPDAFLGLKARGNRIAVVIDASSAMPDRAIDASKKAALALASALGPQSALGIWTFGGTVRGLPVKGDDPLAVDGASPAREASLQSVGLFLDSVKGGGSGGPDAMLLAIEAAAAARPTDIFVFVAPENIGSDKGAASLGKRLKQDSVVVDGLVLAPTYDSDPELRARCLDGALGTLVRRTGGRLRVLLGGESCVLSGQSLRELAEREGRWTPSLDRQLSAVLAQLAFLQGKRGDALDAATAETLRALAPLDPDPVAAMVGPARADVRCLMLAGAIALGRGETAQADQCLRDAAELAGAEAEATGVHPGHAADLREQGARAELLRALHCAPADECLAHARKQGLLGGGWSLESWSARLLDASRGWPASFRAGRSLSADAEVQALQSAELAIVRDWIDRGCQRMDARASARWDDLSATASATQQGTSP